MSNYTVPPPSYKTYQSVDETREPLIAGSSSGGGIFDQPSPGDLPDDFKVSCHHYEWYITLANQFSVYISTVLMSLTARQRFEMLSFAKFIQFFVRRSCSALLALLRVVVVCQIVRQSSLRGNNFFSSSELSGCYRFCWWNYLSVAFCHFLGPDTVRQRLASDGYHLIPVILNSVWAFYLPLFGTLINLGILYWKRHSHPWNLVLLSTFTLLEAFTLGVAISFYNNVIVLQAL